MMLYLMKDLLQLCYMKINTDYLLQPPQDPISSGAACNAMTLLLSCRARDVISLRTC